jgi:hypothetical protein
VLLFTQQHWGEVLKKSRWTWCRCHKYNNLDLSVMSKPIQCIIWCFDFCSEPWPTKYPSPGRATHYNFWKPLSLHDAWVYIAQRQVSPRQWLLADNVALCWAGELQDKLRIVYKHFEHYLSVWTFVMVIYWLVYELRSLSYRYTFVWCLMKCVSECDFDWISDEMCVWMWFRLNF